MYSQQELFTIDTKLAKEKAGLCKKVVDVDDLIQAARLVVIQYVRSNKANKDSLPESLIKEMERAIESEIKLDYNPVYTEGSWALNEFEDELLDYQLDEIELKAEHRKGDLIRKELLKVLSKMELEVLLAHESLGLTSKEIAVRFGLTQDEVLKLMRNGKDRARRHWNGPQAVRNAALMK